MADKFAQRRYGRRFYSTSIARDGAGFTASTIGAMCLFISACLCKRTDCI